MRTSGFTCLYVALSVVTLAFPRLPDRRDLRPHLARASVRPALEPGRQGRIRGQSQDELLAQLLILVFGTPTAYLLATSRFPGRSVAITLVELPLVLPPAVAGIGLLVAFGHLASSDRASTCWASRCRSRRAPSSLAVAFVASPLYIRQAIAAFEAGPEPVAASRTLGASPARTFFRIVLPLARGGLIAGLALSFARGLGEFGATIMFAGSLQGVTQTLPLAIYAEFDETSTSRSP